MSVIQKTDTFGQVAFDQSFHFLGKGTRITQRRTFLNARSENDRVGASPDKLPCPQHRFLRRASPAIAKTDNIYVLGYSLENTLSFSNHFEIGRSRAKIFRLHTPDNPNFHIDSLYKF